MILLAGTALRAHIPLHGVGTECRLIFKEDRVLLTFDLSYDGFWSQSEMIRADTDRSSSVEDAEADAYLRKKWEEKVRPGIRVRIDGREATIRKSAERHEGLVGEIYAVRFSLYYELEIEIPGGRGAPGVSHGFEMEDVVVQNETPARPRFLIPYQGHGEGGGTVFRPRFLEPELQILELDGYTLESARIRLSFSFEGSGAGQAVAAAVLPRVEGPEERGAEGEAGAGTGTGTGAEARRTQGTAQDLEQALLRYDELRWYEVLGLILIAVLYGAGHALTPGHGKSMVAAYLIGTRGRVRDAVILGLATTICHTGSVFLFGAGIFLIVNASTRLSETQVSNMVIVACQLLSGVILLILGITLFLKRWRGVEHGHGHGHHHHHRDHHHGHHHHHHGPHDHHAHGNEPGEPHGHHHGHAHGQEHGHDESHDHDHRGPGPHHHDHPHGHSHHHHHMETEGRSPTGEQGLFQGGTPRLRELLVLGFSGGLVPCPAGLAIIFIGLHYPHRLLFALTLLIFFSIGLGSVLVAIGVFLVTGKLLAAGKLRDGAFFQDFPFLRDRLPARFLAGLDRGGLKLFRILPALSSLFIACLGAFFCVSAFREGKTEIAAMLRHAADWLR